MFRWGAALLLALAAALPLAGGAEAQAPGQVTGLKAGPMQYASYNGWGKLYVQWTEVSGATKHEIRYKETNGAWEDNWVETSGSRWHIIGGLSETEESTRDIQVRAVNGTVPGLESETVQGTLEPPTGPPTNLEEAEKDTKGSGELKFTWTAAPGSDTINSGHQYQLYVVNADNSKTLKVEWQLTGSSQEFLKLEDGTTYYFEVRGINDSGHSDPPVGIEATTKPGRLKWVENLAAKVNGDKKLLVSWDSLDGADSYQIKVTSVFGSPKEIPWTDTEDTDATDNKESHQLTGLASHASYTIFVRGMNDWGDGYYEWVNAIPEVTPSKVPLQRLKPGDKAISAAWSLTQAENGLTDTIYSYDVEYRESGQSSWTDGSFPDPDPDQPKDQIYVTYHTIQGLTNDTTYQVRVRARNDAGEGDWSDILEATAGGMGVPSGLSAKSSASGSVKLNWQMPADPGNGQPDANGLSVRNTGSIRSIRSFSEDDDGETPTPDSYEVGYTVEGSDWADGSTLTVTDKEATVTGLEDGTSYAFRVRAKAGEEEGIWSDTITATPETPPAPPPANRPTDVTGATTAATAWKTLDLSFNAPAEGTDWVAANSQYRLRSMKEGANRTPWRALQNVSVADGKVTASTGSYLAVGRIFELEVRWCGATVSDATCSEASDMAYGASPASAPETAQASAADPASQTALALAWSIANTGGKKNMHAAYEIGYSADTAAAAPETLLDTVPAFGETAAEVSGLTAGTEYRLFVRSVIDHEGNRLFASAWASATATTEGAPALALGEGPGDQVWPLNEAIEDLVLPEATGGTGTVSYELTPISTGFLVGCGLTFDAPTRTISGTPLCLGHNTFTWTATDEAGATDSLEFTATVAGSAPVFVGEGPADPAWTVGTAVSLTLPEASTQAPPLTYTLAPAAWNGVTVDTETRKLSGTPAAAGSQAFTWTVTDAAGQSTSRTFTATAAAADTVAPTAALALDDGVETPAVAPFSITVTFSESVTGFALDDLAVAHGAASELAGSGSSYTATITPEEGYAGNLTVDVAAGAAEDAAGNASTAAETLTVAVAPPVTKPTGVAPNTTAATSWKTLDLSFDAPPAYTGWTAAQSQYRVRSMKEGARRTPWRTLRNVSVADGTASASTGSYLAVGRVFEVELRYCGETISDAACSGASDMVYGASPASAPENAQASATEPASQTALTLSWSIANIGGKKNMHAAYEIGWSADTGATAPETLLTAVPDFGATEAEVTGLEAGGDYRLFVRSVIDWQGARLFASNWASATAGTASSEANGLAQEMLKKTLTGKARRLLEDASDVIGRRLSSTESGSAPLTAFAGLFGAPGPGDCPLEDSLGECAAQAVGQQQDRLSLAGHRLDIRRDGADSRDWSGGFGDLRERVRGQGFAMSLNGSASDGAASGEGVALTLWGGGGSASGDGSGSLFWGMDAGRGESWTAGLAFAGSDSSTSWQSSRGSTHASGFVESEVTAVYPYARGLFAGGLELWTLAGWGAGQFASQWSEASAPDAASRLEGDLGFSMGLVGAERPLYEADGLSLTVLGDAGWSRLAASGGEEMDVLVHRTRMGLEGRYASGDGALTSSFRASARVDGGEESAQGMELAGSLAHVSGRWETGLEGRWYEADAALTGLREQGVRAVLALRPNSGGTGLGLTLSPGWGTEAVGGDSLLAAFTDADDISAAEQPALRLDGRVSWGARLGGWHVLRPWAEFSLDAASSRHLRGGLAVEGLVRASLAVERRESATGPAEHGVLLRLGARF